MGEIATYPVKVAVTDQVFPMRIFTNDEAINIDLATAITVGSGDPYTGIYEVTPTEETITLETDSKFMTANVIVNPIPSNYGRITYNGSTITVS